MESHQNKTAASIASVCRLCFMEREQLELIFDDDNGYLCRWIEKLTSLKIVDVPNAPAALCSSCKSTMEAFDSFREMCINNDHVFKETFCGDKGQPVKFTVISIKMECDEDQEMEDDYGEDEESSIKSELLERQEIDEDESLELSRHVDEAEVSDGDCGSELESEANENVENHDATTELVVTEDALNIKCQDIDRNSQTHSRESEKTMEEEMVDENYEDLPDIKTILSDTHKYPCPLCDSYTSKLHIITHKGDELYKCFICLREFHRFNYVSKHIYKWHKENEHTQPTSKVIENDGETSNTPPKNENPNSASPTENSETITDNKVRQNSVPANASDDNDECKVCNRLESKKHSMTHKAEGLFECYICAKKFNRFDSCSNHLKWHVTQRVVSSASTNHFCKICMKSESQLHVMTHKAVGLYVCNVCKRRFNQITYLNVHMRRHSKNQENKKTTKKMIGLCATRQAKEEKSSETKTSTSNVSDESFSMWNEQEHQRKLLTVYGGRYACKTCKKYVSKLHIMSHKAKELFVCYICKRKFRKFDGVSRHFHTHVRLRKTASKDAQPSKVGPCDEKQIKEEIATGSKESNTSIDCKIENSPTSTNPADSDYDEDCLLDRDYECKVCNKYVTQLHAISHTAEGYQCPVCNSEYNRFDSFSRHVRGHKHQGKYVCDICTARFSCTYQLNRHKKRQHDKQ